MSILARRIGKSEELKNTLKAKLKSRQYQPGEQLPTEIELVKQFGYTKSIVREAIGLLVNEGYLDRIQGKGTFVSHDKPVLITIAVVLPEFDILKLGLPVPLFSAIENEARKHDARILLFVNDFNIQTEKENFIEIINRQVDGVIIFLNDTISNIDTLMQVRDARIPFVLIDRYVDGIDFNYVVTDNFAGSYDTVNSIAAMGVSNIYYVSSTADLTSIRDRMLGYIQAVNDLGLPCNVTIVNASDDVEIVQGMSEYNCIKRSLGNAVLPLAVFASNASLNPVVCSVLEDLHIPSDKCIFGYFDPPYTNVGQNMCYIEVDQPIVEIGIKSVQVIIDKIHGNTDLQKIAIKPNLTICNQMAFNGDSRKDYVS